MRDISKIQRERERWCTYAVKDVESLFRRLREVRLQREDEYGLENVHERVPRHESLIENDQRSKIHGSLMSRESSYSTSRVSYTTGC
jgi:hypothetical protein